MEQGGTRFSITEAKDRMEIYSNEICQDRWAMKQLGKSDKRLFQQMEKTRKLQKGLEKSRGMEIDF